MDILIILDYQHNLKKVINVAKLFCLLAVKQPITLYRTIYNMKEKCI